MSDNKLETFRVGDKHKPRVKSARDASRGHKTQGEAAAAEPSTLGFARIEAILEQDDPGKVQKSLQGLQEALDKVASAADNQKDRAQAKRARVAIERTCDLLTYLFQTKESMLVAMAAQDKNDDHAKNKRSSARKGDK